MREVDKKTRDIFASADMKATGKLWKNLRLQSANGLLFWSSIRFSLWLKLLSNKIEEQ